MQRLSPPGDHAFQAGRNFLALPEENCGFNQSLGLVLPVPYEATTSYKGGTREGPRAILDASAQVELYDAELDYEPALKWGIHTLPFLAPDLRSPASALEGIASAVAHFASPNKLLGILGGEHALSVGVAAGLHQVFGDFVTVQLDAHADLRDAYEGTPYSHACAARRISETGPVIQLGIRSLDITEAQFLREHGDQVTSFSADAMHQSRAPLETLIQRITGKKVFFTLDVDVMDPSIMPSTGTPEPGGLSWHQVLEVVRILASHSEVIAFDCVELSPIPALHAPDFLAAKLVYKIFSLILHHRHLV